MKKIVAILALMLCAAMPFKAEASDPSVMVTIEGDQIRAYNLDVPNGKYIYYTQTADENGDVKRILKDNVLVIRMSDGSKIDPMDEKSVARLNNETSGKSSSGKSDIVIGVGHKKAEVAEEKTEEPEQEAADEYQPTIYEAIGGFFDVKKKGQHIRAGLDGRDVLEFRLIGGTKDLAVVEPTKGLEYKGYSYHIPEYVMIDGEQYTVTTVDEDAFKWKWGNDELTELTLPRTLKYIGNYAFYGCTRIPEIIIPDSVVTIGEWAFGACGAACSFFKEIYIPKTVKSIGDEAFRNVGNRRSYRGYFQGNLTSCPNYITMSNCTDYGIDEEALERYLYNESRKK